MWAGYFSEEAPEYHVACAGSLIGLMVNRESFPVGKVKRMRLYPMTFLEFLRAEGEERLYEYLSSKDPTEPLSETVHSMASDHLKNYYLVGGMPKAVETWVKNRSMPRVTRIQRALLKDYRDDFVKHGSKILNELTAIWDSIPNQLMKENGRMILKEVLPRGRADVFAAPLQWLTNAGLIHCVYLAEAPYVPLSEVKNGSMFKVYPCDIGFMRAMSGVPPDFVLSNSDEYKFFKGAMAETMAVCSIKASGYEDDICYWKGGKNEVDLLVSTSKGVVPIETKFGKVTRGTSLNVYCEKYRPQLSVHLSMNNAKGGERIFVPLYSCETLIPYLNRDAVDHIEPSTDPTLPFTISFVLGDWKKDEVGYRMTIPEKIHCRGSPSIVQLFKRTESGGYVSISTDMEITSEGDVILTSDEMFDGKLSIM